MKKVHLFGIAVSAMFLLACPKNPQKEAMGDVPPEPDAVQTTASNADDADAIERQRLEAERLEAERRRLEELVNRIMGSDIYFEYDQATLTEKARELLTEVGDILRKEPRFALEVEGHTDERGTESYNMSLGGKRSQAVYQYLTAYGVASDRLTTLSFGEERPKVQGDSEDAHAQNRRAAFKVLVR